MRFSNLKVIPAEVFCNILVENGICSIFFDLDNLGLPSANPVICSFSISASVVHFSVRNGKNLRLFNYASTSFLKKVWLCYEIQNGYCDYCCSYCSMVNIQRVIYICNNSKGLGRGLNARPSTLKLSAPPQGFQSGNLYV